MPSLSTAFALTPCVASDNPIPVAMRQRVVLSGRLASICCSADRIEIVVDSLDGNPVTFAPNYAAEPWSSVKELALHLGFCQKVIRRRIPKLPHTMVGTSVRFKISAVDAYLALNPLKMPRRRRRTRSKSGREAQTDSDTHQTT